MKLFFAVLATLLTMSLVVAQPINDDCYGLGPTMVHWLPFTEIGTTEDAADDFTQCGFFPGGGRDVIYLLWLDCPAQVLVSLCGSSFDTYLEARTGESCPGDNVITCNDDSCGLQSQITFSVNAGVFYYVIVQGYDGAEYGDYQITFTDITPVPENDNCPGITFSELPFAHNGTNINATHQWYLIDCFEEAFAGERDVVYTFTPAACYNVTASLCGSGFNTVMSVRSGGNCPGDSCVAADDDFCGEQSQVTFTAEGGNSYYIIVSGLGSAVACGNYTLNVTGTPVACDACPATEIATIPYSDSGSTSGMTNDYDQVCIGAYSAPDVIYHLNFATCLNLAASLCGSGYDTQIFVRTGGACPGDNFVACNDDFCGNPARQSEVSFYAQAGQDYWIIIGGYSGATGTYMLNINGLLAPQSNDECQSPRAFTTLPYTDSGNTACASHHFQPACVPGVAPDVFYQMTLPCATTVTASLCGSGFDTILEIRRDGDCPGNTTVDCNDDYCGFPVRQSQVTFDAEAGVTYYLIVDGYGLGDFGNYILHVTQPVTPPQALVIQPVGNTVVLTWDAACGATQYDIYRATTPDVPILPQNHFASTIGTTYTDLVSNEIEAKYFYAVTANYPAAAADIPDTKIVVDTQPVTK